MEASAKPLGHDVVVVGRQPPSRRFARGVIALVVGYWLTSLVLFVGLDHDESTFSDIAFIGWGVIVVTTLALCVALIFHDMRTAGDPFGESLLAAILSVVFWPIGIVLWRRSRRRHGTRIVGWWWGPTGILFALARSPE